MSRRALLVGVSNVPGAPLFGPSNDVKSMRQLLVDRFAFSTEDIESIENEHASHVKLLARLDALVDQAAPGDCLVFYFAGHGTHLLDPKGEEDEREAICPSDFARDDPTTAIADFQLHRRFEAAEARGAKLTAIFDCCFAGGLPLEDVFRRLEMTSHEQLGVPLDIPEAVESLFGVAGLRFIPPIGGLQRALQRGFRGQGASRVKTIARADTKNTENPTIVFGAGRAQDKAREDRFDERHEGVFTHHFVAQLRDATGHIPNVAVRDRVREATKHEAQKAIVFPETGLFLQ